MCQRSRSGLQVQSATGQHKSGWGGGEGMRTVQFSSVGFATITPLSPDQKKKERFSKTCGRSGGLF